MMASPTERGNWIDDGTGIGNHTIDSDLLIFRLGNPPRDWVATEFKAEMIL